MTRKDKLERQFFPSKDLFLLIPYFKFVWFLTLRKVVSLLPFWTFILSTRLKKGFNNFFQSAIVARREGDENPLSGFVAETMKLLGNSSYVYQLLDRARPITTKNLQDEKKNKAILKCDDNGGDTFKFNSKGLNKRTLVGTGDGLMSNYIRISDEAVIMSSTNREFTTNNHLVGT